jgi:phosphonate degradation associated HDIG domain protein
MRRTPIRTESVERQVLDTLLDLYEGRARRPYGLSRVDQRAHAVQAGWHAREQGAPASLVAAALLHDVGHMVHDLGEHPAAHGIDDRHEAVGAAWLSRWFGPAVVEPVRLHVAAKRYLCAVEPGYLERLTRDSIESLALQGGPMSGDEVAAFLALPYASDAIALRRLDEAAKDPSAPMPPFESFRDDLLAALRGA